MSVRRFFHCAIGLALAAVFAVAAFMTPGIRHRHDGGGHSHNHSLAKSAAHHHHGHAHGHHHLPHGRNHSHSHGHSHSHSHAHSQAHHHDAVEEPSPHIHVSLFGFQLTLPDFLGGDSAPLTASTTPVRRHAKSKRSAVPEYRALPIFPQLVRFVMDIRCLVPAKVALAANAQSPSPLSALEAVNFGLTRPEPPVPPPRTA